MANTLRIRRRATGGAAGAPASLENAELAFNEVDDTLYIGKGTGGAGGSATTIEPIGGKGAMVTLTGEQTISGKKTYTTSPAAPAPSADGDVANKQYVDQSVANAGGGDMLISEYDQDGDGKVNAADAADEVPWAGITGKPAEFPPSTHSHAVDDVTGLQSALDSKAPLDSPTLTGTPTAPTAAPATSSTQIASTAFVAAAVSALVDAAPGALDTLNELATAIGDDPNFAATLTAQVGEKLAKAQNLADLQDAAAARANLGLLSMAKQAADAVAITGGTVNGVTLDGGTF